jgi:hypothetical protein
MKTVMECSDGRRISSGETGTAAISRYSLTQRVCDGEELAVGSVCAAMVEMELILPDGSFAPKEGEEFTVFREDSQGNLTRVGVFLAEKPLRTGAHSMRLTAYDRISLLDRELAPWLETLKQWPYALGTLAQMAAEVCGVPMAAQSLPLADYPVEKLSLRSVTGRQLMRWVGELCGRFCRCNARGELEFRWYAPKDITLTPSGSHYYFQGSLSYETYEVAPIEKVQLQGTGEDVGTVYPDLSGERNTYAVTANPLVTAFPMEIARGLYEILKDVTYTPCKVKIPASYGICAGDIISISAPTGELTAYVMQSKQIGGATTLECTGSPHRQSTGAVNHQRFEALSGRVLELSTTVDGLKAVNRDQAGKIAGLTLDVEGIGTEVSRQESQLEQVTETMTALRHSADALAISVRSSLEQGAQRVVTQTGFTFDEKGLTIRKSGTQMENCLDETGMLVKRSGEVILRADQEGVTAVEVTVGRYLMVGDHSRLENYARGSDTKRTACFWI